MLWLRGLVAAQLKDYDTANADFARLTGRSFAGWHRHITLVSVAHAILMPANADFRMPEMLVAGRSS